MDFCDFKRLPENPGELLIYVTIGNLCYLSKEIPKIDNTIAVPVEDRLWSPLLAGNVA